MDLGRGAKVVVMLAAIIVVAAGIKLAAPLLVPLLLAAFLATVTAPLMLWLKDRGVPGSISVICALLVNAGLISVMGIAVSGSLAGFSDRLPEYEIRFAIWVDDTTEWLSAYGVANEHIQELVSPGAIMSTVAELFRGLAGMVSNLVLVLLIVVFMLFEALGLRDKVLRISHDPSRLAQLSRGARRVNKYLVVKTMTSGVTGILCGLVCFFIGIDFPILWGLLAFLLNFIPTIGSIVAAVPPVILSLVTLGPGEALLTAGCFLGVNFSIGNFIEPRILGRTLGLSPLVVFLSMVFWAWLLGPVGALLAVPLTMVVRIALDGTEDLRWVAVLLGPAGEARAETRRESLPPKPTPPEEASGDADTRADTRADTSADAAE